MKKLNVFTVTKIQKSYSNYSLNLIIEFNYRGRNGECTYCLYSLLGKEAGIEYCNFDERAEEDIYQEIHDWFDEHIDFNTIVKYDGKILD